MRLESAVIILADSSPGELRVAAIRDGRLLDYAITRPGAPDLVGAVLRGRVAARVPALAGAFVVQGGSLADGFLPDSAGGASVTGGDIVAVRVTRAAQGGKGPRLALAPADPGAGPLGLLTPGPDALMRVAGLYADAKVVVGGAALLAERRQSFGERISAAGTAFDETVEAQIEALSRPECPLPGGGRMTIEPTAALVAVDLDMSTAAGMQRSKAAAHQAANAAFLPEVARQIRLRNLGGPIVVDFAGLAPRKRAALGPAFAAVLASDPMQPRFLGFSALGLAEILRPRVHPPLHELVGTPHAEGLAALREMSRTLAADPGKRLSLRASPAISDALLADAPALEACRRRFGQKLILRTDHTLPSLAWHLDAP